ncbi:MAG: SprT family zinc-dependent metalloprotease [Pseudomonadota bacterium]
MINDKKSKISVKTRSGCDIPVRLEVNKRAKRLILRIDETAREGVAVSPNRRALADVARFAQERADWLEAHLGALPAQVALVDGAQFNLRGQPCEITLQGEGRLAYLREGEPMRLHAPGIAETIERRVLRFLKAEAKTDLTRAVERYCDALGVAARRVTIKDTKSRWGSCTSDGRLAFSWRVIMAPPDVLEYLAAHECAHLLEMNHSPKFWAHVERCRPTWKRERNWLRRHGRELHAVG